MPRNDADAFLRAFAQLHQQHREGVRYHIRFQREAPIVRALLRTYSQRDLEALAVELFTLPAGVDDYIDGQARTVQLLSMRVTWLDERVHARRREQERADIQRRKAADAQRQHEQRNEQETQRRASWRNRDGLSFEELQHKIGFLKAMTEYSSSVNCEGAA